MTVMRKLNVYVLFISKSKSKIHACSKNIEQDAHLKIDAPIFQIR